MNEVCPFQKQQEKMAPVTGILTLFLLAILKVRRHFMDMRSKILRDAERPDELKGLRVVIDRVVYMPDIETPPDRPHAFAFFITIQNDSDETVTIKGRKWVITNDAGEVTVVEGDGVVGEFPHLEPGEHFSYNSYHINNTLVCWAEGSYLGVTEDGRKIMTRIPKFEMQLPVKN